MIQNNTITGIDIGTDRIKIIVSQKKDNASFISPIYTASYESKGVHLGYITDKESVSKIIKKAINDAEKETKKRIKQVVVSIGGISLCAKYGTGVSIITKTDNTVTENDIEKSVRESEESLDFSNKKIIHTIPVGFKLDGKRIYGRPEGMKGNKLETRVLFISLLEQHIQDLISCIESSGVNIQDIVATPFALSSLVLTDKQKIAGCVLIDIGHETVSSSVFKDENLVSLEIYPIGSLSITNDIALCLKISLDEAEMIKTRSASFEFPEKKVNEVIEARLSDIFESIDKQLKKINRSGLLPAGAIIVGGGAKIQQVEEVAKEYLKLPIKIFSHEISQYKVRLKDTLFLQSFGSCVFQHTNEKERESIEQFGKGLKSLKAIISSFLKQLLP